MSIALKKHIPDLCCWSGVLCLFLTVASCLRLTLDGWKVHVCVAAAFLLFAGLAVLLLRLEKVSAKQLKIILLPIGAAMLVRALCMDCIGSDYTKFLLPWVTFYRDSGGFCAISAKLGNYNVPYLYILALISYANVEALYPIKLVSVLADVLLAWGGFRLVRTVRRGGIWAPLAAFALLLLLPTAVLNSAYWAQCDAIYGALIVHAIASVLEGKNYSSAAMLGAAFCFKLQAVFLVPLWGVLFLAKRVKFRELFAFPAAYLIMILPALLLGKPLWDIINVYFHQTMQYADRMNLNSPSIYALLPVNITSYIRHASLIGIAAAFLLVFVLLGIGFMLRKRLDDQLVLIIAVVLAIGVPFFLPHMHERYFFLADVLTTCWLCVNWRRLPAAVLSVAASLYCYSLFLFKFQSFTVHLFGLKFSKWPGAVAMLAALIFTTVILIRELKMRKAQTQGADESKREVAVGGNLS